MPSDKLIDWLLAGDVSIQYQVHRDLYGEDKKALQERIAKEGWGSQFLSKRNPKGHWGERFYQPKWTSSHYTLLDLRNLCISPKNELIQASLIRIAENNKAPDGGINPIGTSRQSDVCINGMFLNYAAYFKLNQAHLESVVDCLLSEKMHDGGFNCMANRSGAVHSSLHSTISVLEGFTSFRKNGYTYRVADINKAKEESIEFILCHKLYRSDHTGAIINKDFIKFPYPGRWRYDILRALDYFQDEAISWDSRMQDAIDVLLAKRNKDGTWNLNAKYPGQVHFEMEKAGKPSRYNTLRALRVLRHFKILEL